VGQVRHLIADDAVAEDDDHEDAGVGQGDELDLVEDLGGGGDAGDDADVAGQGREYVRNQLGALLGRLGLVQLLAQALDARERAGAREGADVEAEGLGRGDAAGGGVGLVEVAEVREVCHDVADGGGGEMVLAGAGDGP